MTIVMPKGTCEEDKHLRPVTVVITEIQNYTRHLHFQNSLTKTTTYLEQNGELQQ
jgi:hypothetical protein